MTDWARLRHAFGSAEDVPALLHRLETPTGPTDDVWGELWTSLYHQGSVYSASFAALPALTALAVAEDGAPQDRDNALLLASAVVGEAEQGNDIGDVRALHATDIATLLERAGRRLREPADAHEYVYLLQAVLALEGVPVWGDQLDRLVDGEFEAGCPACGTELLVAVGEEGFFCAGGDYVLYDDVPRTPLRPAAPSELSGLGQRLYETAHRDGQQDVADGLTRVFGGADCTACGAGFTVADGVVALY